MRTDRKNRNRAFAYFQVIGEIPTDESANDWCLHHRDTTLRTEDRERYDEWRIEDLTPMLRSEHTRLHAELRKTDSEYRRRISQKLTGHEVSEATRKKISESCKGHRGWLSGSKGQHLQTNHAVGWKHSDESRRKMSEKRKGKKQSESEKRKRANSLKTFYESDEGIELRKSMSEKRKGRTSGSKGKHWNISDEAKRKISEARKRYWAERRKQEKLNSEEEV